MPTTAQGEKRTFDDDDGKASKPKVKRSKHGLTVPYSMYSTKEQECLALQVEVNKYKEEWMRKRTIFWESYALQHIPLSRKYYLSHRKFVSIKRNVRKK